jgi:protein-disulfide isomerase
MTPRLAPRLHSSVRANDHVLGPETAPVTMVEYGDFECPHCRAAHPVVAALHRHLGDKMRFVYRHFPLSEIHPHAQLAAEAAEAAGAQGSFWKMHDMLFANQHALGGEDLLGYALALGLDVSRFYTDLTTHVFAAKVRADFLEGVRGGVNGTPTFFINRIRYDGARDFDDMLEAIEESMDR